MATIVLQAVGAAIGAAVGGPVGATIGRAVGAAAGYAIDQKLFSKDQLIRGRRLEESRFVGAGEGMAIPRVYGRMRVGGQLIWATRFEEVRKARKRSAKGGPAVTTTEFSYFGNFAIAICEGEVSHLGRIWADGEELDRTRIEMRFYRGSATQEPDPLIEAKQGDGNAPAYRGIAYAVFEGLPLGRYGNRIPQLSFEIIRSVSSAARAIRSVCIIPGASEYGYSPSPVSRNRRGIHKVENRHTLAARSDWTASIDELQAICPNLESVSLVIAWFGTDLRAGNCKVEPRVESRDKATDWTVSGLERPDAMETSRIEGNAAYGGTPSDKSVVAAIADLKSRGLKVNLYPFLLMDIPEGNGLPDPQGAESQPPYPWRGRITCHPAPGVSGSADRTSQAALQLAAFAGGALPGDFTVDGDTIRYSGPTEWSWRRMVLHYASLAGAAGGVDGFLIGSEFRGLTSVRDETGAFPFVGQLKAIAADVRSILGPQTRITYAADWSEYHGYQPQDGSEDRYFNLDPLWADPAIDAVGIDWYVPLTDWRDAGDPGNSGARSSADHDYLVSGIEGGEGFDWYYASGNDRLTGNRTPIADGEGEPWIWRFKDIRSWWLNPHHERIGGVRQPLPTAWQPAMKPVWFTEAGCPAIDRGANQPNVFVDAKSSESALPHFSAGGRDDLVQHRYVEAVTTYWTGTGGEPGNTPVSPDTGLPMIAPQDISFWAWDSRPFPAFPMRTGLWSDGLNWHRGHWLNGRLGGTPLDDLLKAILSDFGFPGTTCLADGFVEGYILAGGSPRAAIEPLIGAFNLSSTERNGQIRFIAKAYAGRQEISASDLARAENSAALEHVRSGETELPAEVAISHGDAFASGDTTVSASRRTGTGSMRQVSIAMEAVLSRPAALALADARLRDFWIGRDSLRIALPFRFLHLEPSDRMVLEGREYQITALADGPGREIEAIASEVFEESAPLVLPATEGEDGLPLAGQPLAVFMNLPLSGDGNGGGVWLHAAVFSKPWPGAVAVLVSPALDGFEEAAIIRAPSTIMELAAPLAAGPRGRWDWQNSLELSGEDGEFQSLDPLLVLAGGNRIAVETPRGWELIQFQMAELLAPGRWRLSGLLRGLSGTDPEMREGAVTGANAVLLDRTVTRIELPADQRGIALNWAVGPVEMPYSAETFALLQIAATGIGERPLSPVHLTLVRTEGTWRFTWKRRSRIGADNWDAPEIPLDEPVERYRMRISAGDGAILFEAETETASLDLTSGQRAAFPSGAPVPFTVSVSQMKSTGDAGPACELEFNP